MAECNVVVIGELSASVSNADGNARCQPRSDGILPFDGLRTARRHRRSLHRSSCGSVRELFLVSNPTYLIWSKRKSATTITYTVQLLVIAVRVCRLESGGPCVRSGDLQSDRAVAVSARCVHPQRSRSRIWKFKVSIR